MTDKLNPGVDNKTAKGLGEGGHAPHPDTPAKQAPFDPHSYKVPSDAGKAKEPEDNEAPIAPQPSTHPKGTGHETAKGGVPEEQPTSKEQ